MPLRLQVVPGEEPLTLDEAKRHLRVTDSADDATIDDLIVAARTWAENFTGRVLITQTWDYFLDAFVDPIELPRPPLQSVSSINYVDVDGALQLLATTEYVVDTAAERGMVRLAYGKSYPGTRIQANAVTIRFVAGYGLRAAVPGPIRSACLLLVGELYARRETAIVGAPIVEVPVSAEYLLWPYRTLRF